MSKWSVWVFTFKNDVFRIRESRTAHVIISKWCEFRQVYSSLHRWITTSHDQFSWIVTSLKTEWFKTQSNGSQFWQIYSSFSLHIIYSQILHENTYRMHDHQTGVISNWASLFIIPLRNTHSSVPMKRDRNCNSIDSILPFRSFPSNPRFQSYIRNSQRRNHSQSSILLLFHNSSKRKNRMVE